MEKKQQKPGTLPKETPKAIRRNTNTDENIERTYEEGDKNKKTDEEFSEDDAAHEELRRRTNKTGTDF